MSSKIYNICAIVGAVLCLTLCLIFIPDIGALKFLAIVFISACSGLMAFELSYLVLFKFLESTNPRDWTFAVMEKVFIDGTKKYQPVVKTVKFGYFTNIDKTFLSSVANESEFDTYEEAEEMIRAFKELEIENYNEEIRKIKSCKCMPEKKPKVVDKKYHII